MVYVYQITGDKELDRLMDSARALAFEQVPSRGEITSALFQTLEANGMRDQTHVRLTLTRGAKVSSGMDPRLNKSPPCLIVLAEGKRPVWEDLKQVSQILES